MRQAPVTIQIAPHSSFRDPFLDGGGCCFCSGSRPHGNLDTEPGICPDPRSMGLERIERELGQQLSPSELRTTEFAPAHEAEPSSTNKSESPAAPPPAVIYGPPQWARSSFTHGFPGCAFTPQPDGSLRCPANPPLALISWPLPNLDLVSAVLFLASRSSDLATVLVLRLFSYQCSS
jgi:hypothetical protein